MIKVVADRTFICILVAMMLNLYTNSVEFTVLFGR